MGFEDAWYAMFCAAADTVLRVAQHWMLQIVAYFSG